MRCGLRDAVRAVPHGGVGLKGGWKDGVPNAVGRLFAESGLADGLKELEEKHPAIRDAQSVTHLGSLGGGNHFIEVCLDEEERVWAMLHSGSARHRQPHRHLLHRQGARGRQRQLLSGAARRSLSGHCRNRGSAPMAPMNRITGRSAFLALLKDEGITHLFGNPGTTELPIMHALKEHPDLTYVLGLQEALVVAMADGYSRASGKLVACNVHVAPGLGNAMGSLFNAKFTGTPMILTAGQQEQGHGLTEPLLYDPLVPIATPLVKWAVEVTRLEDLPRIVRRAAKVAMTPPTGPVFISLPGDILNAEAGIELGASTRVDTRSRPSDAVLDSLAKRLLQAERPVIIVGDEIVKSDALQAAAKFAETLGAPVYQQSVAYGAHFLSEHPCFMGGLSRDQRQVRGVLSKFDLLIALGSDPVRMSVWSEVEPLPDGMAVVHIGLIDWDMGKNFPAEMAVRADLRETLMALAPVLGKQGGDRLAAKAKAALAELAKSNWTAKRVDLVERFESRVEDDADRSGLAHAADRQRAAEGRGGGQRGPHRRRAT